MCQRLCTKEPLPGECWIVRIALAALHGPCQCAEISILAGPSYAGISTGQQSKNVVLQ